MKKKEAFQKMFTWIAALGGVVVLAMLLIYAPNGKTEEEDSKIINEKSTAAKESVDMKKLEGVEFFPDEGQEHVPDETRVIYKTSPPTSGRHYARWLPPGMYEEDKALPELLVHNLEHGNVVIYVNRDQLSKDDLVALQKLPLTYSGQWDGVVLVNQKGPFPIVLTAWRAKMALKGYDGKKIDEFLDAFRGRGPEHPVR